MLADTGDVAFYNGCVLFEDQAGRGFTRGKLRFVSLWEQRAYVCLVFTIKTHCRKLVEICEQNCWGRFAGRKAHCTQELAS
jgi:hypothetical protein